MEAYKKRSDIMRATRLITGRAAAESNATGMGNPEGSTDRVENRLKWKVEESATFEDCADRLCADADTGMVPDVD